MGHFKDLLAEIEKIENKYGSSLRDPVSDEEIERMKDKNKTILPIQYISFLKTVNGLDFNGLVIYGIDKAFLDKEIEEEIHGFIETNELWHENEWQRKYVFFGDSDVAWYCYDLDEKLYVELDKPSGTFIESFEDFGTMITDALEAVI
ncbi:YrhA family protein [Lentibacillus sp. CBA3610]|uniref:YrhA family protein n=1 Tax=Lentibacillus sp. CBA3610 TaxID=2518176 RepID=UPI001595ED34|nr:YrhA family protein [Lentibacillus sp. CBA3610]QKY70321.1 SMI1/KNR4 family protein [Lentibacillus sp. CBA3610]